MALALALLLAWFLTAAWMALMRGLGLGKRVRREGPQSHLAKEGTPSMGGVAFLLAAFLAYLAVGGDGLGALWLLALGFALLGLLDDLGGSLFRPLRAREKLLFQGLMALVFALWAVRQVAYTPWPLLDVLLIALAVVGAANAFNFTDGLDGLLASVAAILLLPFYPYPLAQALLGGVLGFLWHNAPRAKVFMGDTGSQALGAAVAGLFVLTGKLWLLPLAAIVPVLEVLSVVAQVLHFRRTGRRLLRMSPLHHHFELLGWEEGKIVFRFAVVTALATALAFGLGGGA
ncbi:phospho-N-acetylmuramoyl-pentapeptide-transferase [Thermus thermamylovorans]|uniref:Phospho-N-acetylmuramoyl-pentapeptide-transferase n=1 Tax=Thermus thermamylovorans TaxID=2509362 RepID=A0A4Q9B6A3_9DEIN|nr:phospho-N-acetylmuramoyl-pentapeptide-transferase [Thermus thermamylovorans]TBH21579.1 phospho-N-acetylmuramoyl-pentapeptide-transferase [Thermus thermamylovorans]